MMSKTRSIRYILAAVLTVGLLFMMTACGGGDSATTLKDVPSADLAKAMSEAESSLPDMETLTEEDPEPEIILTSVSDIEFDKVEGFFICYSKEGKADEIVVLKMKDAADAAEAETSLNTHKEKRSSMYATYDPSQVSRVDNGIVFSEGQYAVLIVTDHPTDVQAAFSAAVSEE